MRNVAAAVAVVFGLVTIVAGGRVLAGADPGYVVYRPLLIYNVVMGALYVAAGLALRYRPTLGRGLAAGIFAANLTVLLAILVVRYTGGAVAIDSVMAMVFRTAVWMAIALITNRVARGS